MTRKDAKSNADPYGMTDRPVSLQAEFNLTDYSMQQRIRQHVHVDKLRLTHLVPAAAAAVLRMRGIVQAIPREEHHDLAVIRQPLQLRVLSLVRRRHGADC